MRFFSKEKDCFFVRDIKFFCPSYFEAALEVGHLVKRNEKEARLIFNSEKSLSKNQKVVFGRCD